MNNTNRTNSISKRKTTRKEGSLWKKIFRGSTSSNNSSSNRNNNDGKSQHSTSIISLLSNENEDQLNEMVDLSSFLKQTTSDLSKMIQSRERRQSVLQTLDDNSLNYKIQHDEIENDDDIKELKSAPSYQAMIDAYKVTSMNFKQQFIINDEIMDFNDVYEVKQAYDTLDKEKCAIKVYKKMKLNKTIFNEIHNEVKILQKLKHENIINFKSFYEDEKNLYVITELLDGGGNMYTKLKEKEIYSELEAQLVIYNLCTVVKYLHNNNIVHRDIRLDHLILIDRTNDSKFKLVGFEYAKEITKIRLLKKNKNNKRSSMELLNGAIGTLQYISPEALTGKYSFETDVWSIGVVLYLLLCGYPPYAADSEKLIRNRILKNDLKFEPEYWQMVSYGAKDLVKKILVKDINKRYSIDDILSHKWMETKKIKKKSPKKKIALSKLKKKLNRRRFRGYILAVIGIVRFLKIINKVFNFDNFNVLADFRKEKLNILMKNLTSDAKTIFDDTLKSGAQEALLRSKLMLVGKRFLFIYLFKILLI